MELMQVLGVAILGAVLAALIRPLRPEMAVVIGMVSGLIVLLYAVGRITGVLDTVKNLAASYGVDSGYVAILLKIIGIAYAAQFGAQICTDAGETAVAGKVELCGRVLILAAALPVVATTLATAVQMLKGIS